MVGTAHPERKGSGLFSASEQKTDLTPFPCACQGRRENAALADTIASTRLILDSLLRAQPGADN